MDLRFDALYKNFIALYNYVHFRLNFLANILSFDINLCAIKTRKVSLAILKVKRTLG